jgi:hypothetical protein
MSAILGIETTPTAQWVNFLSAYASGRYVTHYIGSIYVSNFVHVPVTGKTYAFYQAVNDTADGDTLVGMMVEVGTDGLPISVLRVGADLALINDALPSDDGTSMIATGATSTASYGTWSRLCKIALPSGTVTELVSRSPSLGVAYAFKRSGRYFYMPRFGTLMSEPFSDVLADVAAAARVESEPSINSGTSAVYDGVRYFYSEMYPVAAGCVCRLDLETGRYQFLMGYPSSSPTPTVNTVAYDIPCAPNLGGLGTDGEFLYGFHSVKSGANSGLFRLRIDQGNEQTVFWYPSSNAFGVGKLIPGIGFVSGGNNGPRILI